MIYLIIGRTPEYFTYVTVAIIMAEETGSGWRKQTTNRRLLQDVPNFDDDCILNFGYNWYGEWPDRAISASHMSFGENQSHPETAW